MALALAGNAPDAQKIAESLNKDFPLHTMLRSYWLPTIRAAIEINRKNPTRSIELLRGAASHELGEPEPYVGWMHPVYIRAKRTCLRTKAERPRPSSKKSSITGP